MGKSKITAIGKITTIRGIKAEGLIFQGEGTRLVSNFSYDEYSDQYYNSFYDIRYQVKSGTKYIDLFSIRHNVNKSIYRVSLLNRITSKGNSIGPREEKTLSKLKKEKITENKTYAATAYIYQASNPVQFCTIPFLEDEVKNWILTAGQQTYSEKDLKALAKSLIS
jgi:hypothetical protein